MSDHKANLALQRDRQLAALRAKMDRPERFTLRFACAKRDHDYSVRFARLSATARFTCERIEPAPQRSAGSLLRGLLQPRGASLRVPASEVDFGSVTCAGCGQRSPWTLCSGCGAFICGSGWQGSTFRCRASCGTCSERTGPLTEIGAEQTGNAGRTAIGPSGRTALPTSRGAKP